MTQARSGPLILASALIGLGVVFLVQRVADLAWDEAWPLFVILVGAVAFVSATVHGRLELGGIWAFTWPVVWIVVARSMPRSKVLSHSERWKKRAARARRGHSRAMNSPSTGSAAEGPLA